MGVIAAALVAVFWRVIFTSDMFFYRDVYNFSYPHAKFIHDMMRQGRLPYWDPYLNYGEPVLADPNFLFFYPDTLLLALLPASLAYTLHYLLHFAVAALGAYCLARRFSQSAPAALFAALSFGLSGPLLSLGNFYNEAACAAWIPWALLLTDRVVERRTRRSWILLALVFTLQFLAAEHFTLMATFALCFALAMWRSRRDHPPARPPDRSTDAAPKRFARGFDWRLAGGFLVVGVLVLALSAASLLPSLDLLAHSQRGSTGMPYRETVHWSFHPLLLLEFVLPEFFGSVNSGPSLWTLVLSTRNMPYFTSLFVGFVPLLFALAGWALGQDVRRRFVAWAGMLLLLLSFGAMTPLFALAYLVLPPLALVRFPVKLLVLVVLMIALLAGWGFDEIMRRCRNPPESLDPRRKSRLLRPLRATLAGASVVWVTSMAAPGLLARSGTWILVKTNNAFLHDASGRLKPAELQEAAQYLLGHVRLQFPILMALSLGAVVLMNVLLGRRASPRFLRGAMTLVATIGIIHVALVNRAANPTVPIGFYTYTPPVLSQVPAAGQPYRFCQILHGNPAPGGPMDTGGFLNFDSIPGARSFSPLAQVAFRDVLTLKHGSLLTHTETTLNNDVDLSYPPYLYDFWYFAIRQMRDQARSDRLIGRTNVKYLIRPEPEPSSSARLIGRVFNGSAKPAFLYEDLGFLPRALVAASAVNSSSSLETLTRLSDPEFDPWSQVILAAENERESAELPRQMPALRGGRIGDVSKLAEEPNTVALTVNLTKPGLVVVLDRFDPNWHATVDGREVRVHRANQLFRAVQVDAGEHQVVFFYRQKGLLAGVVISGVALVGVMIAWWKECQPI